MGLHIAHLQPPPRAVLPLLTLPRLFFLLLLLHICTTATLAQRIPQLENSFCAQAGKQQISADRRIVTCPCLFSGYAISNIARSDITFSLYAMPDTDFRAWFNSRGATSPPLTSTTIALPNNNLGSYNRKLRAFGWISGTRTIPTPGRFRIFSLMTIRNTPACLKVALFLERKPAVCPLRLAGPEAANSPGNKAYVVGGTRVRRDEFAAYNALLTTPQGNCTGSLISANWVLTAAHCGVVPGTVVRIGGTDLSSGTRRVVRRAVRHPDFIQHDSRNFLQLINDLALAELSAPVTDVRPLALNSNARGPTPGTIVRATGYGKRTTIAESTHLHMVDNVVLGVRECRHRFFKASRAGLARGIDDRVHVCTGRDSGCEGGGVCFGDSGGPMVARVPGGALVQVGITSYGDANCARRRVPDVFVRVSRFVLWVQTVTGGQATVTPWATINNNGDMTSVNGPGSGLPVPVWVVVLGAAFGGFLLIAAVLIGVVRVRESGRRNGGTSPGSNGQATAVGVQSAQGPSSAPSGAPPSPPPPPEVSDDTVNAVAIPTVPSQPSLPPPPPPPIAPGVVVGNASSMHFVESQLASPSAPPPPSGPPLPLPPPTPPVLPGGS